MAGAVEDWRTGGLEDGRNSHLDEERHRGFQHPTSSIGEPKGRLESGGDSTSISTSLPSLESIHCALYLTIDVGDSVLALPITDEIFSRLAFPSTAQTVLKDRVETLGFVNVTLDTVWDFLWCISEEVVGLTLPEIKSHAVSLLFLGRGG
jgi:hypothetical protein